MRKSSGNRRFVVFCLFYFFFRGRGGIYPVKVYPDSELYETTSSSKNRITLTSTFFYSDLCEKGLKKSVATFKNKQKKNMVWLIPRKTK